VAQAAAAANPGTVPDIAVVGFSDKIITLVRTQAGAIPDVAAFT
jgi:hypothetical protein